MRRCCAQVHVAVEAPQQVLAAPPETLDAPPAQRVGELRRRQRARPARVEDLDARRSCAPSTSGASWRRIVSTSGSSGIAASAYERLARQRRRRRPVSQRSTRRADIGQRAVVARAAERPPAARRASIAPLSASSGAYSRVWSVPGCGGIDAVVGGERPAGRPRRRRSSQLATRASISRRARVEALGVLAVAVDLVGLDQVREDEAVLELARAAPRRRSAPRVRGARVRDARRRRRRTGRRSCRRRAPARRRPAAPAGSCARAARSAKSRRPSVRANAPAAPVNGRAITRPTACSPLITARARRAARIELRRGTTSTCAASCSTESCEV